MELHRPVKVDIWIRWIMFTAAITGMALIAAFYPLAGNIPLIVIPSILVLIFSKPVVFERLKLTTLVTMRIVIIFAALALFNPNVYVDFILLALIVNIMEATLFDFFKHHKYFNGVSGLALAAGVFTLRGTWPAENLTADFNYYVTMGMANDMKIAMTIMILYAIAYTIWNWIFVTDEFSPAVSLMHVGFLGAPLIGSICTLGLGAYGGIGMWLLLRANSLSIGGWMQIAAKDWFEEQFYNEKFTKFIEWTHKTAPQIVFMIINLALIATCFVLMSQYGGFHVDFPGWSAADWITRF